MKSYIKMIIIPVFILLSLLLITGCGEAKPQEELSGVSYKNYKTYQFNNEEYTLYCIDNEYVKMEDGFIFYKYDTYQSPNVSTWTINYLDNNKYYIINTYDTLSNEEIEMFNENIKEKLNEYQEILGIEFDINKPNTEIEKEFTLHNINQSKEIYVITMYIPFNLNKYNSYDQFTILVPVKTIATQEKNGSILIKLNENLEFTIEIKNIDEHYNILNNLE